MKRRITRVEIRNYRQYENVSVDFDESKNIYAFEGKGGSGKSNFLNAIAWCLYGKEPLKHKDDEDYLLSTHLKLSDDHKSDTVSVQIDAIIGPTPVRFLRTRVELGDIGRAQENFSTYYLKNDDWVEYKNSIYFVDNFLPESLREFFMFDGENVKSIFKPGYERHIKKNTEVISYIELIKKTSQHLDKILADTRRQLGQQAPDLSDLVESQALLAEKINKTQTFYEEDKDKLKDLEEDREKYREQQKSIDAFKSLTQRRDAIERGQDTAKRALDNLNLTYQNRVGTIAPYAFLHDSFADFKDELSKLEASGDLPPKVNPEYVRDLIDGTIEECVCGHKIDEVSKTKLSEMLDALDRAQSKSYLLASNISLARINHELHNVVTELTDIKKKIAESEADLANYGRELADINRKIGDAGGAVGDLQLTINNLDRDIENTKRRIWNEEHELKQDVENLRDITRQIDIQGDVKNKHQAISNKIELLELCIKKLNQLGEQNLQKSRLALSESMKTYFKELYWKKDYVDVYINENFEIVIEKDVDGRKSKMPISQLAGSEGATLGYSLMKGFSELSGFKDTPVFIDGPLSDFSEDMQREFLNSIKSFVPYKQLFVFFKEDSYLVEPYIDDNQEIIQAFKIHRDEKAITSTVGKWEQS